MDSIELKRKLRQLKKLETQIRFKDMQGLPKKQYIWDKYFSTKNEYDDSVKYNIKNLLEMNHEKLKEVFNEYFIHVYFQYFNENGITDEEMYDVTLLSELGLPPGSSIETIKSRFRELAKKYHPDLGGDSEKFIEIVDIYKKLTGEK